MERVIQLTGDGSHTLAVPGIHATYHSKYGAIQESMHVFIEAGLTSALSHHYDTIRIFEMGFGTGLNALLSLQKAIQQNQKIYYYTADLFPLQTNEYTSLNYATELQSEAASVHFMQLHQSAWEENIIIHPLFTLHKTNQSLLNLPTNQLFNLIYFDAFAPHTQPELWTPEVFKKMFDILEFKGMLVTYCSKGDVRRAMKEAGFTVEKLPGPPGKREMLRAIKNNSII